MGVSRCGVDQVAPAFTHRRCPFPFLAQIAIRSIAYCVGAGATTLPLLASPLIWSIYGVREKKLNRIEHTLSPCCEVHCATSRRANAIRGT